MRQEVVQHFNDIVENRAKSLNAQFLIVAFIIHW